MHTALEANVNAALVRLRPARVVFACETHSMPLRAKKPELQGFSGFSRGSEQRPRCGTTRLGAENHVIFGPDSILKDRIGKQRNQFCSQKLACLKLMVGRTATLGA